MRKNVCRFVCIYLYIQVTEDLSLFQLKKYYRYTFEPNDNNIQYILFFLT